MKNRILFLKAQKHAIVNAEFISLITDMIYVILKGRQEYMDRFCRFAGMVLPDSRARLIPHHLEFVHI